VSFDGRKEKIISSLSRCNYRIFASKDQGPEMHLLDNDSAKDRLRGVGTIDGSGLPPLSADARLMTSTTAPINDHLDALEAQSIYIFREAFARLKKLALLWSLGKDSNVMIWLARKAFFGRVPFRVPRSLRQGVGA
jgi:hypothetical protein